MPGTLKIWWHDGATKDVRYNDIPVVNEPELGFETVAVSAIPVSSGPAPAQSAVAIVETDVNIRYVVRPPGVTDDASVASSKPIAATGPSTDAIGVAPGYSISVVEA